MERKTDGRKEAFNSRGLPWNDCASLNPVKRVRSAGVFLEEAGRIEKLGRILNLFQ